MGGMAGVVKESDEGDIGDVLKQMMGTMRHREADEVGIVIGGIAQRRKRLEDLDFNGTKGRIAFGHVSLVTSDGAKKLRPVQSKNKQLNLLHYGQIYNVRELLATLNDDDKAETDDAREVVLRLIEEHYEGDLATAVKKVLPKLDGVYCLAVTDNKQMVITRDKIGLRQLYFSPTSDHVTFASEKKSLMAVSENGTEIQRLMPGHLAILDGTGVQELPFWDPESIRRADAYITDKEKALEVYAHVLTAAIRKRIADKDRVGIVFSGGIDSLLLAYLVQKMGIPFTCYTAGVEGAPDIEWARSVAERFHFPLKIKTIGMEELERHIPHIITAIEDHSLNQVEAAIALYFATRMAHEEGEHVILTGQGADELFGGYPWYSTIVDQEGYDSFEQYSWEDALLGYKETFERENKIATAHGLEMSVPYVDPAVIEVAFQISPELKIRRGNDRIQKRIHREFAVLMGIPEEIAFRKKEAAQHGANVHTALEELAGRAGFTDALLLDVGYDPDRSVIEKLGSSSRYGFRYGDHHLWKPQAQMQYYLDSRAAAVGFLPPAALTLWNEARYALESERVVQS